MHETTRTLFQSDADVLRSLTERYLRVADPATNAEKIRLWKDHHSVRGSEPPVLCRFGMHNAWAYRLFTPELRCEDPFLRRVETKLRVDLFHADLGDDHIFHPWITCPAIHKAISDGRGPWGIPLGKSRNRETSVQTHASPLTDYADARLIEGIGHRIDEETTQKRHDLISTAVGDMTDIEIDRGPLYRSFRGDISSDIAELRGLENLMMDTYLHPNELHQLLARMRDIVLASHDSAEAQGHLRSSHQTWIQNMPYSHETPDPSADDQPKTRDELWYFAAAQEYTLISPEMHDAFVLQYQIPILARYRYVQYGCCENLTRKIDMLRQIPNLRVVAVTPSADVAKCAEQIGTDYCISWRPNPTDMICSPEFHEDLIRKTVREASAVMQGLHFSVSLKDVETAHGEPDRWKRWLAVTRDALGR